MKCKARRYSDQNVCHDCKLVWDVNDPDPPKGQCDTDTVAEDRVNVAIANIIALVAIPEGEIRL